MGGERFSQVSGITRDQRRWAANLGLAVGGLLVSLAAIGEAHAAQMPPTPTFGPKIDPFVSYDAQDTCSPSAKPGTQSFHDFILKTYPNTGDFGIVRACNVGGTSEHKEGRAWDWKVNVNNAGQKDVAETVIKWLLKTDQHGNACALARRHGIMYFIWNNRIWGGYRSPNSKCASAGWKGYTGSNPHTDHVHLSWGWAGAKKQTSWYTDGGPMEKTLKASLVQKWSNAKKHRGKKADYIVCAGDDFKYSFTFKNKGSATWRDVEGRGENVGSDVFLVTTSGKKDKLSKKVRYSVKLNKNKKVRGDHKAPNCSNKNGCRKTTFVSGAIQAKAPKKAGIYRSKWRLRDYSKSWGKESRGFGPKVDLTFRVKECTTEKCGCWVWCTDGSKRKIAAEGSNAQCKEAGKALCQPAKYLAHQYTPCGDPGAGGSSGSGGSSSSGGAGGSSSSGGSGGAGATSGAGGSGGETGGGDPGSDPGTDPGADPSAGEEGDPNGIPTNLDEDEFEQDEEGFTDDGFNGDEEGIENAPPPEEGEITCAVSRGSSSGLGALLLAAVALGAFRRRRVRVRRA